MEDYAGRILAHRYRLPLPPSDEHELVETRAFDTRSGQEVLVRQVPLPEVVDAELLDGHRAPAAGRRSPADLPAVRRAIDAAQAAAAIPDHPRLDQVFDVFAEGGSLWIVSELVPARPLAALIADEPMSPYRAAEVAADVLTALRVLHAHGWTHRNITVRTVLVCDDGRVMLTGLAAGAAEDALCGYDPVPGAALGSGGGGGWGDDGPVPGAARRPGTELAVRPDEAEYGYGSDSGSRSQPQQWAQGRPRTGPHTSPEAGPPAGAGPRGQEVRTGPGQEHPEATEPPAYAPLVAPGYDTGPRYRDHITPDHPRESPEDRPDLKAAARAGAVAAYRAGTRAAAARVTEQRRTGSDPGPEPRPEGSNLPQGYSYPYGGPDSGGAARHGAAPRPDALAPVRPQPESGFPAHDAGEPPAAPAQPEPATGLPAQLALPQGYQQAEPPADRPRPAPPDPATPWQGAPDAPRRPAAALDHARPRPHLPLADATPGPGDGRGPWEPRPGSDPGAHATGTVPGAGREQSSSPAGPAGDGRGGPRTGLDAERARQTRMAVVGAVTERWAPEQAAGPVHGHWQLAPPVGPATDLWALGALLYRAVQGHAPYPEDSVAELVELVCAEPPAFAEECGALRPVVESLLRQDPTERPDFEELRGWLRSLVRSAPEPDAGFALLPPVEPDPARLPVVRRRGDLHGRHRNPSPSRKPRAPRALGRMLLVAILVLLAGAVAYAMLFMPRSGAPARPGGAAGTPTRQAPSQEPSRTPAGTPESKPAPQSTLTTPAPGPSSPPAAPAPEGYTTQQDPEHFEIAVPYGWERRGINESGQVRYTDGQFVLTVVPGRDKVEGNPDPAAYQKDKEPELTPYRTSTWSTVSEVKSTKVGQQLRATGKYTWIDGTGRNVVARNFVVALGGSYHVVVVTGPQDDEGKVTEVFEKATASYRAGG
ncbi:hypothetical protein ACWFQ8_02685 [Streptomyces sp. NPDC055254]